MIAANVLLPVPTADYSSRGGTSALFCDAHGTDGLQFCNRITVGFPDSR